MIRYTGVKTSTGEMSTVVVETSNNFGKVSLSSRDTRTTVLVKTVSTTPEPLTET